MENMKDYPQDPNHFDPFEEENEKDESRELEKELENAAKREAQHKKEEHAEHRPPTSPPPSYLGSQEAGDRTLPDEFGEQTREPSPALHAEPRPVERPKTKGRTGARGTAAMDPKTRQEVARKGGLAVSRNKQHMAEIGRKGGQAVSKNREHMAQIGRKGGAASRGHR